MINPHLFVFFPGSSSISFRCILKFFIPSFYHLMDPQATTSHLPHFPSIIKLDRLNYSFWRTQAITTIHAHGYGDFISPTTVVPSMFLPSTSTTGENTPSPTYGIWMHWDKFLLSGMLSSVSESMLGHVARYSMNSGQFWCASLCHNQGPESCNFV